MSLSVDHPSHNSSFSNPLLLPLRSIAAIASDTDSALNSALVIAPHPDDETLGCGGAIALLQAMGCAVQVLVISDGTRSHPHSIQYPPLRLRTLRETETQEALSILGMGNLEVTFLRLPDGSIPTPESADFQAALDRCCQFLQRLKPATLFLPWRLDPHPDHQATWHLIHAALANLKNLDYSPRLIEYPIWDWDPEQRGDWAEGDQITAWRLDISSVLDTKLKAIAAYRSQTTDLINDDPQGFRLTPEMLENFARPWELYLEELDA